jgi:CBS domain-containing protein
VVVDMARTVDEVMTHDPRTVSPGDTVHNAASEMRDADVGAVLVEDHGKLAGIVTDRDIVVRAVADGADPDDITVEQVYTRDPVTLTPDQPIREAVRFMREKNVRRVPVVQGGRPVGIVSLGDLAVELDEESALADISSEMPNN